MKPISRIIYPALEVVVLASVAFVSQVQAVVPPPDGCFPNYTTAEGCNALRQLTSGAGNTGVGWYSLFSDSDGNYNAGLGAGALALNNGTANTAVGAAALLLNTTGSNHTAVGSAALLHNTAAGGDANTAIGSGALYNNTIGNANTAVGLNAIVFNTTGNNNTAIGNLAGYHIDGDSNICIGAGVEGNSGENNTIRIGDNLPITPLQAACYIGGIFNQTVNMTTGLPVYVDIEGKLGVGLSSRRFKRDIESMEKSSEAILSLKPVRFHYKSDPSNTLCFGLIAEDVAEVNPELVIRDQNGKPLTVRYEAVNAMLLNEFLKEHRKVQELQSTVAKQEARAAKQDAAIAQQRKQIDALTTGLQKVTTQVKLIKPAPQTVLNSR